jgi:hypothetical protein
MTDKIEEPAEHIADAIEARCAHFHAGLVCDCWEFAKVARAGRWSPPATGQAYPTAGES